jgi:sugar phosphate permease
MNAQNIFFIAFCFLCSVFCSVSWPCVTLVVEEKLHGTAYGLMSAFQNTAQFSIPLMLAGIYSFSHTFSSYEICFIATSLVSVFISLMLWYLDEKTQNGKLRMPSVTY